MFLGVDQSLNGTGLCLLSADAGVVVLETVWPGELRGVARLAFVKSRVAALLKRNVVFVSFEGYSYNSVGRVFELGEIGGVLKLLVHENNTPSLVVAPAALKKFAVGNSRADKDAIVKAAAIESGVEVLDDNQADAYHLALIAWFFVTGGQPSTRARLEVLRELGAPPTPKGKRRVRKMIKNAL